MPSIPIASTNASPLSQSILVVEDESIIRELLCEVLEIEGYTTLPMENADLALAYMEVHFLEIALLLTDINMPGVINGAELANTSNGLWPSIPVVVMSGFETLASAGIHSGALFVGKPFTMDQMMTGIRAALDERLPVQKALH